ncbi:MAG: hypothetical protein IJ074_08930 [Clostridia bacterium]|nr:hypothetical protein [Clostridia bacterium]
MKKALLIAMALALLPALCGCTAKTENQYAADAAPTDTDAYEAPIDLDLSALSGTVVYSQVYAMMESPDEYEGQRVRMRGDFSYYQDPDSKREYFAAIIADATACCAQGIEFVWSGTHTFPQDYPPLGTDITVTGTFCIYMENGYRYIQLNNAELIW